MIGVVLCGGKSTRMGADKGLIKYQSFYWAEVAANTLSEQVDRVVLSVNEQQYFSYGNKLTNFLIVKDEINLHVNGPLKGLLSVHLQFPSEDLLVLACDMVLMNSLVIKHLLVESSRSKQDVTVFKSAGGIEPLCGIYTAQALEKIYQLYTQQQLSKHSMYYLLEKMHTNYLLIPENWKSYFNNFNLFKDVDQLKLKNESQ